MSSENRDPAGAQEEGKPVEIRGASKSGRNIAVAAIIVVACAVIAAILIANRSGNAERLTGGGRSEESVTYTEYRNKTFGDEGARVEIIAVLPFGIDCHNPTIEYLHSAALARPSDYRVRFIELHSAEGKLELDSQFLENCAAVIIDGSAFAKLPNGDEAVFMGPVGDKFTIEELAKALEFRISSRTE